MISELFKALDKDKIKINFNKNPIEMDLFLSFLKVDIEISRNHLGYDTGWTLRFNKSINLKIHGGIIGGKEYVDCLEYGSKLGNSFNNYVNPFYLFEIMTDDGKKFFVEYYKGEIEKIIEKQRYTVNFLEEKLEHEKGLLESLILEYTLSN